MPTLSLWKAKASIPQTLLNWENRYAGLGILLLFLGAMSYFGWFVIRPAVYANYSFAAFYTAAHILVNQPEEWSLVYQNDWFAAQIARTGFPEIYDVYNANPPTTGFLFLPLLLLPVEWGRLAWVTGSLLSLITSLWLMARLLKLPSAWVIWMMPFCCFLGPVASNFGRGQLYLYLLLAFMVVCWSLLQGKQWLAGLLLGLLLIMKTAGSWLFLLLLLTRHWKVIGYAIGVAIVVALATLPWIGLQPWLVYAAELPRLATSPVRYVTGYQTITSLFGHLLVYDARWNPTPVLDWPLAALLLTQGVFLLSLVLSLRWARLHDQAHEGKILTLALFFALVVANAPLAEDYHYTLALPAILVALWWYGQSSCEWPSTVLLGAALVLLCAKIPYQAAQLNVGWFALLAYPRVYGAYLLWFWLLWQLQRLPRAIQQPPRSCPS
ncbi:MAG: glycosyltransferase family 87 protein [Caldilineaceae bacterium]